MFSKLKNLSLKLKALQVSKLNSGPGFSIEIKNFTLEYRGEHNGLPLYEALGGLVTAVAFVNTPAIKVAANINDDEKTLSGPIMIPNLKMFRKKGPNGKENCYWYFTDETIKNLRETYNGKLKIGH